MATAITKSKGKVIPLRLRHWFWLLVLGQGQENQCSDDRKDRMRNGENEAVTPELLGHLLFFCLFLRGIQHLRQGFLPGQGFRIVWVAGSDSIAAVRIASLHLLVVPAKGSSFLTRWGATSIFISGILAKNWRGQAQKRVPEVLHCPHYSEQGPGSWKPELTCELSCGTPWDAYSDMKIVFQPLISQMSSQVRWIGVSMYPSLAGQGTLLDQLHEF